MPPRRVAEGRAPAAGAAAGNCWEIALKTTEYNPPARRMPVKINMSCNIRNVAYTTHVDHPFSRDANDQAADAYPSIPPSRAGLEFCQDRASFFGVVCRNPSMSLAPLQSSHWRVTSGRVAPLPSGIPTPPRKPPATPVASRGSRALSPAKFSILGDHRGFNVSAIRSIHPTNPSYD